jgi:hypothetical protein
VIKSNRLFDTSTQPQNKGSSLCPSNHSGAPIVKIKRVPILEQNIIVFNLCQINSSCFLSGRYFLMGRASRHTPQFLGKKLELIRKGLGVKTFEEMVSKLDMEEVRLYRSTIHEYEKNKREPPLIVLLRYARLAGLSVEILIDDHISLPDRFNDKTE